MIKIEAESKEQFCKRVALHSKIHQFRTINQKIVRFEDFWIYTDPNGQTYYTDYVDHLQKLKTLNQEEAKKTGSRLNSRDNGMRGWVCYDGKEFWSRRCISDLAKLMAEKTGRSATTIQKGFKRDYANNIITLTYRNEKATIKLSTSQSPTRKI